VDGSASRICVIASEYGGAGSGLLERSEARDDAAEAEYVRTIYSEDAVVEHVAENGAARTPIAKLEHACVDGSAAGISIGRGEDRGAGAGLLERAVSRDEAVEGVSVGPIDSEDPIVEHVTENGAARAPIAKLQGAGVDGGTAGISRIPGDDQCARTIFDQRTTGDRSVG